MALKCAVYSLLVFSERDEYGDAKSRISCLKHENKLWFYSKKFNNVYST